MIAGFILGLSLGLCISMLVYVTMDCKMHDLKNQMARVFKQSTNKWRI